MALDRRPYFRALRERARARNLCVACRRRPRIEGRVRCSRCLTSDNRLRLSIRLERTAKGLCLRCGDPLNGYLGAYCPPHQEAQARYNHLGTTKELRPR